MAYIKDIIINIFRATKALFLAGFGKPLILGETAPYYTLVAGSELAGLKFTAKTRGTVYINVVIVDPEANSASLSAARTGAGTSNTPYLITINLATNSGGTITSTAAQVRTAALAVSNIAAIVDIALAKDPGSGVMAETETTALTDPGRYHEISELKELLDFYPNDSAEYKMAAAMFAQSPRPAVVSVYSRDPGVAVDTALSALQNINDTWYGICINNRTKTEIQAAATWANSNKKLFAGCTSDLTTLDARTGDREIMIAHDRPLDYPDCALMARCLPLAPGSITWKDKVLAGQVACGYDTTTLNLIRSKNGIALTEYGGAVTTNEGTVMSGEYIDTIHFIDWVNAQLEARLFKLRIDNPKLKMDNSGLAKILTTMQTVFVDGGEAGGIAEATTDAERSPERSQDGRYLYLIKVPTRDQIPVNDRAARHTSGIEFSFEVAGAIHKMTITGRVTA